MKGQASVADAATDALDPNEARRVPRQAHLEELRDAVALDVPGERLVLASAREDVAWRLRSFTPAGIEVRGAGHNALGAWWWLAAAGRVPAEGDSAVFAQETGGRVLPVEVTAEAGSPVAIVMEQEVPAWGDRVADRPELAATLGLSGGELSADLPAQVVSTGTPHLLVQARNRAAVDRAAPDPRRLADQLRAAGGEGCYLYSLDPVDAGSSAYARFFNPTVGISEDPATGTAAGYLASHLVAHGVVGDGATVLIEQGHATGRPSLIEIRVHGERVSIAGACVVVVEGTLRY